MGQLGQEIWDWVELEIDDKKPKSLFSHIFSYLFFSPELKDRNALVGFFRLSN